MLDVPIAGSLVADHGSLAKTAGGSPRQGTRKLGQINETLNQNTVPGHQGYHGVKSRLGIVIVQEPQGNIMASRRLVSLPRGTSTIISGSSEIKEGTISLDSFDCEIDKQINEKIPKPVVYNLFPLLSELAEEFKQSAGHCDVSVTDPGKT